MAKIVGACKLTRKDFQDERHPERRRASAEAEGSS